MNTEMRIVLKGSGQKPKYDKTARELLDRCREFYQDPENEKAFQEWLAAGGNKKP